MSGWIPALEAGTYRIAEANTEIVVAYKNGKLLAHSKGLPETPLENLSGRRYKVAVPGLDGVFATFRPAKDNPKETEMFFEQPGAKFVCKRVLPTKQVAAPAYAAPISVDELMRRVLEAQGGEANLRRHKSLTLKTNSTVENQGLTMKSVEYLRAPNSEASEALLYAGRKRIGYIRAHFDGQEGGSESSFGAPSTVTADNLADVGAASTLFPELTGSRSTRP